MGASGRRNKKHYWTVDTPYYLTGEKQILIEVVEPVIEEEDQSSNYRRRRKESPLLLEQSFEAVRLIDLEEEPTTGCAFKYRIDLKTPLLHLNKASRKRRRERDLRLTKKNRFLLLFFPLFLCLSLLLGGIIVSVLSRNIWRGCSSRS